MSEVCGLYLAGGNSVAIVLLERLSIRVAKEGDRARDVKI